MKPLNTTDTPRTEVARFEALRSSALRQDCIPLKLGQELERELAHSLQNQLKTQAEVERLLATKQLKLSIRPYDYECGDGCCSESGETWSVDGVEVAHGPCDANRLQQLLKHLGYDSRIIRQNEDGEEVCEL